MGGWGMRVRFFANLRDAAGGRQIDLSMEGAESLSQVIDRIVHRCPDLGPLILTDQGDLASHIAVIVNGRDMRHLDGMQTKVTEGDQLDIFPPVGGGETAGETVHVHFAGDLHALVGGGEHRVRFHGKSLRQLLEQLTNEFDIEDEISADGEIKPSVQVTVNGRLAYTIGGWEARVHGDDRVWIFSFGGALQPVKLPEGTTMRELAEKAK